MLVTSAQLGRLPSGGEVAVAGLVIARQRPGTAGGTMFLLFEDEFGTINLIVPRAVYERHRQLARAEPLLLARGRLERDQEEPPAALSQPSGASSAADRGALAQEEIRPVINVLVRELAPLERFLPGGMDEVEDQRPPAVRHLPDRRRTDAAVGEEAVEGAEVGSSMRAVAPPVTSFAAGRRR
jgi:error-prone DNA polymerase